MNSTDKDSAEDVEIRAGSTVELQGLQKAPSLNGQRGTVEFRDEESGRWAVRLGTGDVKKVLPANLAAVAP